MAQPEPIAKRSTACSQGVAGAVDRLSALPDGVIHTVLSFLPAPEVVRTCLLSRRWRSLWRSVPRINLDMKDFGISMMTTRDGALEEKWARFEDFATNLLLFHDNTSSLGEFRLSSHIYNQRHVDRWIRRGIEYCPSLLKILIYPCFKLPPIVGSNFCHLKTLNLRNADLGSHFTGLLCSTCPVMEDLELENCEFSGNSSQRITSSTLKKLVLDCCVNNTGYPLLIAVPSLANLCLMYGCYQSCISLCKMDSLVKAEIHVAEYGKTLPQHSQRELLCSLYNVTSLKLLGFQVKGMLNEKSDKFPIFRNMRTLELDSCFLEDYELYEKLEALGSFLQSAPCLEKLILKYCMFYWFFGAKSGIERKNITLHCQDGKTFQCPKLKLIEVIYDQDNDHELVELLWSLGRSLPDASIKLKKI
ncbi:hypothetical protein PAHAL_2G084200 [Panicum hallii]|uniref:F-box domain-containing protein n=1 Tax=Panicum hallii TaxID=206008 RepID=A0A2S3GWU7_9POAL|nr:MEIOTIC F-BOX protein MOF-like isoform X1 [Panicum hallii]PAN10283.1 hypothetical protein PAHAL_2G084200 [Panicum hallii]